MQSQQRVEQHGATPEETPNWACLAPTSVRFKNHAVLKKTFEVTSGSNLVFPMRTDVRIHCGQRRIGPEGRQKTPVSLSGFPSASHCWRGDRIARLKLAKACLLRYPEGCRRYAVQLYEEGSLPVWVHSISHSFKENKAMRYLGPNSGPETSFMHDFFLRPLSVTSKKLISYPVAEHQKRNVRGNDLEAAQKVESLSLFP